MIINYLIMNHFSIDMRVHKKPFRRFYTFELMIHFLAEEDLLNMHSDTLLNITPGV